MSISDGIKLKDMFFIFMQIFVNLYTKSKKCVIMNCYYINIFIGERYG